jgi:hypothetical protein
VAGSGFFLEAERGTLSAQLAKNDDPLRAAGDGLFHPSEALLIAHIFKSRFVDLTKFTHRSCSEHSRGTV